MASTSPTPRLSGFIAPPPTFTSPLASQLPEARAASSDESEPETLDDETLSQIMSQEPQLLAELDRLNRLVQKSDLSHSPEERSKIYRVMMTTWSAFVFSQHKKQTLRIWTQLKKKHPKLTLYPHLGINDLPSVELRLLFEAYNKAITVVRKGDPQGGLLIISALNPDFYPPGPGRLPTPECDCGQATCPWLEFSDLNKLRRTAIITVQLIFYLEVKVSQFLLSTLGTSKVADFLETVAADSGYPELIRETNDEIFKRLGQLYNLSMIK